MVNRLKMVSQGFAANGNAVFNNLRRFAQCEGVAFNRVGWLGPINVMKYFCKAS